MDNAVWERRGYSWRIPGKDRIGVGLGEFYIRGMKKKPARYKRYFESQGIRDINSIKGAFVSYGNFVRKPIKNNVLLVGDAASLIDAMTGEGIYFAIESGRLKERNADWSNEHIDSGSRQVKRASF